MVLNCTFGIWKLYGRDCWKKYHSTKITKVTSMLYVNCYMCICFILIYIECFILAFFEYLEVCHFLVCQILAWVNKITQRSRTRYIHIQIWFWLIFEMLKFQVKFDILRYWSIMKTLLQQHRHAKWSWSFKSI